jgi:predicted Zn-dependent protease
VELAEDPQESWLSLLLALRMEREEYDRALPLLKQLAARFPKKIYWLQLAAVFAELGREQDALATMQLAHAQGFVETDSEQRNLARMYLYNEIPTGRRA